MMGQLNHDQGEFFYSFRLDEAVPDDHPVRAIAAVLDLSWVRSELAPFYPKMDRPSIDPVLMIRMLVVGYTHPSLWARRDPNGQLFGANRQDKADYSFPILGRCNDWPKMHIAPPPWSRKPGFVVTAEKSRI
jgi:hypothetical protein